MYFNHLKGLILRVKMNLVLSKVLYLKFVNKKYKKKENSIKYSLKKCHLY